LQHPFFRSSDPPPRNHSPYGKSTAIVYDKAVMNRLETAIAVPLTVTDYGTIRIADSRVSPGSVVHHYKLGATVLRWSGSRGCHPVSRILGHPVGYMLISPGGIQTHLQVTEASAILFCWRLSLYVNIY
jgi:hypothetical protein